MTLVDSLALMEKGLKLQGEGLALIEEGAQLQTNASREIALILLDHVPRCPVPGCGKLMELKASRPIAGHRARTFWSCNDWEKHKKSGDKCSISYESWIKGVAKLLATPAQPSPTEPSDDPPLP